MVEEAARDWEYLLGHMNYWLFIVLMMTGFYIVVAKGNLVKKIVGLNIFQTSVFMFYISIGKVEGGTAPIFPVDMNIDPTVVYSNPLPHVLILTAIVVGVATTSLGLALIVRIREEYGTIEEDEILKIEKEIALREIRLHSEVMGERG
jgi:multicomponent Na+:H+ antiporter subunit C